MKKILVTAISGDIGNGILKILKDQPDIELYGYDINAVAVGMDMVKEFYQCKFAVEDGYIEELLNNCKRWHITHLIPVNEREIEVVNQYKETFNKENICVISQETTVLEICLNKAKTAEFLKEERIRVPKTYAADKFDIKEHIGEKFICKPAKSNGSKDIYTITVSENTVIEKKSDLLVQQYIDGDEYTVGVFSNGETIKMISFKRELKNGYSNMVELVHDSQIEEIALNVAGKLKIFGYINIQMRKKDGEYYIFEINPRISGTVRFRHMLGFKDVLWWLNINEVDTKREVQEWRCTYSKAVGMRELNEKYVILEK